MTKTKQNINAYVYFIAHVIYLSHLSIDINSLAPGKFEWNFRHVIFKQILVIDGWGISCEIALTWMSLDFIDDQSTLVQVMIWCRQAASHYLSQCWPRFLLPYGVTRPRWVNSFSCCRKAPSHYLNQYWLIISKPRSSDIDLRTIQLQTYEPSITKFCLKMTYLNLHAVSQGQWVNSLGPNEAICRWRSWSTLVQVMACCLTAPRHYLNQCWRIISKVLWHSSEDIIVRRFEDTTQ